MKEYGTALTIYWIIKANQLFGNGNMAAY